MSFAEAQESVQLSTFVDALLLIGEARLDNGRAEDGLPFLHAAFELARSSSAPTATKQQRAALRTACLVLIRAGLNEITAADGDVSIDSTLVKVEEMVESAGVGSEGRMQWRINLHEQMLHELEGLRQAHENEPEFERKLIRNNITAVLGLSLPQRMRDIQARWRDAARHVAPHALKFAEQEYELPQTLGELLGTQSLERIEAAVETGEAGPLIEALTEVESALVKNLELRLDETPAWLPPGGKVNIKQGMTDPKWLSAKSELERGNKSALDAFRTLDYSRNNTNLQARMWHGYALAVLGRAADIHDIREIFADVVKSENFNPKFHAVAHWNLAVACSRVPAFRDRALDELLPILDLENHPAGSLDLALLWASTQQRDDVLPSLYQRCRHYEAHLLSALHSARSARDAGVATVAPEHLRRVAAVLRAPDKEFPHPAEEIRDMRRLDQLVEDFKRLQLADAGIEWFRQRLNAPRERYSYKNWECLASLYEFTHDYGASWQARLKSLDSTIKSATRRNQPNIATRPLVRVLEWGQRHEFQQDALRTLRKHWEATAMTRDAVAAWERRLAPAQASPGGNGTDQTRRTPAGQRPEVTMDAGAAQLVVDRLTPLFDRVSTSEQLVEHAADVADLLRAAGVLGRSAPDGVEASIRDVLAMTMELEQGAAAERIPVVNAGMREAEGVLIAGLNTVPVEVRGLTRATLNVIRHVQARFHGVPDLTITMPDALRMSLAEPAAGQHLTTRLAVRLSNPASEPALDAKLTVISETNELVVDVAEINLGVIAAESKTVVDFRVMLTGIPANARCGIRCHVAYRSAGIGRAVHARAEVPTGPAEPPVPVTERFVINAPVSPDRVDLFHGRERELEELKEAFAGNRLRRLYFVNGIRRVGKSSLMRHLGRACGPEVLPLIVTFDMDAGLSDMQLVRVLVKKINIELGRHPEFGEHTVPLPTAADFELDTPWTVFEDVLRRLQRDTGRKILLCLDELQEVVQRIAAHDQRLSDGLLSQLREHAQQQSDLLFICTGSESFDVMKRRFENRLWGNMQPYNVSFVDRPAMNRIATVPLQPDGVTWLPEALDVLWDLTEGHPWVTQVLAAHAVTALNRDQRRTVTPGDIERGAELALADANISDLWWNENEGLVTASHRQVAYLVLKHQPSPRRGVTTDELFQACARSGIQSPGIYVDTMASLELLSYDGGDSADGRWRVRGGFLEKYLQSLLAREVSESRVDTSAEQATQPLGIFLDVENIKRSLVESLASRPREERIRLERRLEGDELGRRLLSAAKRHGKPTIKWAVANWHAGDLQHDQMAYKSAGYQPDIADNTKPGASDHVLREHIHRALRELDLGAYVIGTGDGDFQGVIQTLQSSGKYLVLWATRKNMSNAFGANLRSDEGLLTVEFLEDIVFADDRDETGQ
ncbi:NYN domain-containing protein [Actinophytocola sp.]|uniref:NYN domain-containing protein n=1 Tax=Actinophytocola sp. TaxID=1872138 RepID=UPI002ED075FE